MKLSRLFRLYCILVSLVLFFGGLISAPSPSLKLSQLLLLPLIFYFLLNLHTSKLLRFYNFLFVSILSLTGLITAASLPQLFSSLLVLPLALHFWFKLIPRQRRVLLPEIVSSAPAPVPVTPVKLDPERRRFLKLIGSAGMSVFILSLFTDKAQAAFFGSVPGPGTVALKDTGGSAIDPAEKHPTDGYKISRTDDSSPAYYGFTDKDHNWFIIQETDNGDSTYTTKYAVGTSGFSSAWTNRGGQSYGEYFDKFD